MISQQTAVELGRIRWQRGTPSLMGRGIVAGVHLQVFVLLPGAANTPGATEGVWLDAEVLSTNDEQLQLRTSFARFVAEPTLACRWPADASPLTRRELEQIYAESVTDVSATMANLVSRFRDDPQLRQSPLEQLRAYSTAMRECARKVEAIAGLIESVSQDLSAQADRSMLVVAQPTRTAEMGGLKRF